MRDIIYRGKTKDGEWEYGGVVIYEKDAFIITKEDFSWSIMGDRGDYDGCITPVLPETVGQYTGLTDKNGKKIFEGDILKIARVSDSIGSYYFPPLVYPVNVVVRWDMCAWTWETLCKDKRYIHFPDAWCHYECEVIGNIHDNPELLEVK